LHSHRYYHGWQTPIQSGKRDRYPAAANSNRELRASLHGGSAKDARRIIGAACKRGGGAAPTPFEQDSAGSAINLALEHSHIRVSPDFRDWQNWWAEEAEELQHDRAGKEHVYGQMPLVVLGAESDTINAERLRQLYDMVQMSTDSLLLIDPQSGHRMQLEVPWLVTQSIRDIVDALRAHRRLDTR